MPLLSHRLLTTILFLSFSRFAHPQVQVLLDDTDNSLARVANLYCKKTFIDLLQPLLIPRVSGSPGNAKVRQHIKDSLPTGWSVEEDAFTEAIPNIFGAERAGEKIRFVNLIANTNPAAKRKLTLVCHHDSKYFEKFDFIGATDSAAPCAMLLSLAHSLRKFLVLNGKDLKEMSVGLQFLFLDGEEAFGTWSGKNNLYGARHLAHKWQTDNTGAAGPSRLQEITTFLLLDLIGAKDVQFVSYFQDTQPQYDRIVAIETKLSQISQLEAYSRRYFLPDMRYNARMQDDHIPFLKRGVPILHVIPPEFPSVWHVAGDNGAALHHKTLHNLNRILTCFVVDELQRLVLNS